jgi:putative peptidoglycan lipid II flippase
LNSFYNLSNMVGNEGQQPLHEQGEADQRPYYSWQYDQGGQAGEDQLPPALPQFPQMHQLPQKIQPPIQHQPLNTPPLPPVQQNSPSFTQDRYQEPIPDMGTSLGYGQGMEYQYFDAPQPSQPMARLRQERLQQLREERLRRQQRRIQGDITTLISRNDAGRTPSGLLRTNTPPVSPEIVDVPGQMSPVASLQSLSAQEVNAAGIGQLSAAAPAQDTGMIQRARIGRATMVLTFAFIASRILGLLRTSMFAFVFGTGSTSDAYLQAFLVPDLIFNIVAGGALSSAFIPVFTKYMIGDNDERSAWHIASSALNLAVAIMVVLAAIVIIFARALVPLYNPGVHDPKQLDLIASLTRIMLLQSIALGGGVIVTAVLNARQDFRLPAIGTVLYNVGLILGLLPGIYFAFRGQRNDTLAVYVATWGVVVGALLQVGIQIPGLFKVGMHYSLRAFDWRHPGVIQIGRQMIPRIVNAGMLYASTFVDRGLLQLLVVVVGAAGINGLITQYYQAFQLVLLPLGVFGMAISTAAFPTLAENVAKNRFDRVRNTIMETLRGILFMSIPSSIGLIVLGFPIIQALLQHGRYSLADAQATTVPLAFFALGLTGLATVEILTRSFYALRDSTTPVIVSVGQFIFKIALSLMLIDVAIYGKQWGMGALAFSTSLAGLLEAVVLFWLLYQRIGGFPLKVLGLFIGRVVLASLAMGVALLIVRFLLDTVLHVVANVPLLVWVDTLRTPSLGFFGTLTAMVKLLVEMFVGVFVYIRSSRILGIEELGPVRRVLDRLKLSWI